MGPAAGKELGEHQGTPLEHNPVLWDPGLFHWEICDPHLMGLLCFLLFLNTSAELVAALLQGALLVQSGANRGLMVNRLFMEGYKQPVGLFNTFC